MRKLLFTILIVSALGLAACGKDTAEKAENSVSSLSDKGKAAATCASIDAIAQNYNSAIAKAKDSEAGQVAGDQFKNALEALKSFVPSEVQAALQTLRDTNAPIDPKDYNPQQKQARKTVDNYLADQCDKGLDGKS